MYLLFPADPFQPKSPDEGYAHEVDAAKVAGIPYSLISIEDLQIGSFKVSPQIPEGSSVIYRGWMLPVSLYTEMHTHIQNRGSSLITSPSMYEAAHHLPNWYPSVSTHTPDTIVVSEDANFEEALKDVAWPEGFFVKDFVKSLTTSRGSIAGTPAEVSEVVSLIKKYRGSIEGGVCIRRVEMFLTDTEERYFVFKGIVLSRNDIIPAIVKEIAVQFRDSVFYSVDVVKNTEEQWRLIEIGDGQVSDLKKWDVNLFMQKLNLYS